MGAECKSKPFIRQPCFNCQGFGHIARNCPIKKAQEVAKPKQFELATESRIQEKPAAQEAMIVPSRHQEWAEGDMVMVDDMRATVFIDLRPKHSYAKVVWADTGEKAMSYMLAGFVGSMLWRISSSMLTNAVKGRP